MVVKSIFQSRRASSFGALLVVSGEEEDDILADDLQEVVFATDVVSYQLHQPVARQELTHAWRALECTALHCGVEMGQVAQLFCCD